MSFSVTKSMTKSTLPLKGEDVVIVTLTMEAELAANPRDILIAWDYFGSDSELVYPGRLDPSIRQVLLDLVGLTGGADGKLGNGNRVALYGNRASTGEIRTEFTADTAVILAALDAAKAAPQTGLAIVADSMVEMLANAANRKTALLCNLANDTALNTAERDKLANAGIEMFTLGGPRPTDVEPWGGLAHYSIDRGGPAMSMAGIPQNLHVVDYLGTQFRAKVPISSTIGEATYESPVITKPYRMSWVVGAPEARTGVQTYTMTYTAYNLGPDVGEQTVSTLHYTPQAIQGDDIGQETVDAPMTVTITGGTDPDPAPGGGTDPDPAPGGGTDPDPAPGGGTDPDPAPGGGTDPNPAPGNSVRAEAWPAPTEVTVGHCKDAVQASVPDAQLLSLGRLVQLDVVLKNICPGKRVSATVLLTEKNADGAEETRAMKHILVPAQTGTVCADVTLRCIQFSVPEALDLTGDPTSICNERKFNVRVIANYVDSDMVLCDTSTATV